MDDLTDELECESVSGVVGVRVSVVIMVGPVCQGCPVILQARPIIGIQRLGRGGPWTRRHSPVVVVHGLPL